MSQAIKEGVFLVHVYADSENPSTLVQELAELLGTIEKTEVQCRIWSDLWSDLWLM